jgi:site-specific DNA-methyltransferase (cytosine-N4-specific)
MKAVGRKFDPAAGNKNNPSFDAAMAIMPNERNKRSVWTINTMPYKGAHFATYPPKLIEPCILAGTPPAGIVLDPFGGSGTTGAVAQKLGRRSTQIELNPDYFDIALERVREASRQPDMFHTANCQPPTPLVGSPETGKCT